ncbi:MAG: HAD family hydrolase [Treponema sp.]
MPTTYLFDMGSTLLEFHNLKWNENEILKNAHSRVIRYISDIYGQSIAEKIDTDVIIPWYSYTESERKIKNMEYRICEALFLKFSSLEVHLSYRDILEILKTEYFDFYTYAHPNENALECLKILKARGCKIGIVSNTIYPKEIYLEIFKRERLDVYIDTYTFSYENTYMKPHPSIFLRSLMALDAKISETVMVGDNEEADIKGAKAIGLKTCLYDKNKRYKQHHADYSITNFMDIIDD